MSKSQSGDETEPERFYRFVSEDTEEDTEFDKNIAIPETQSTSEGASLDMSIDSTDNGLCVQKRRFSGEKYRRRSRGFSGRSRVSSGRNSRENDSDSSDSGVPHPLYNNHQLIGDSQFVRFSKQILNMMPRRSIGYCVSGQNIKGLYNMLISRQYKIHHSVIVMIGTNDLAQNTPITVMKESYLKVLDILKEQVQRIVLVTIPPIQNLADSVRHWKTFTDFNNFILTLHNGKQIFVVDFGQHLVGYSGNEGCKEYFEDVYSSFPERTDLMHLNRDGFLLLKFLLDLHYFKKF